MTINIRYWDRGAWANYVRKDILPLYKSSSTILNLWEILREVADGKLLSSIIKDRPTLEYIFVGGTSPPDKYEEDSLAKIYNSLLGTSISLREYYFLKAHGKEPKTLCTVSKTAIIEYIEHISVLLERVVNHVHDIGLISQIELQSVRENSKRISQEILNKPENLPEMFVEFLNNALKITVAYNPYTRFIWHLRKISRKYIKEFYPEMLKLEVFKFIQELLGLREYIIPQVEDPEIAELYTIYSFDHEIEYDYTHTEYRVTIYETRTMRKSKIDGIEQELTLASTREPYLTGGLPHTPANKYPYTTMGGCLCRVNELIWGLFENYDIAKSLKLIIRDEVPKPLSAWENMVKSEITRTSELPYPDSYEALSRLDEYLPAIFTGEAELIKMKGEKKLALLWRW